MNSARLWRLLLPVPRIDTRDLEAKKGSYSRMWAQSVCGGFTLNDLRDSGAEKDDLLKNMDPVRLWWLLDDQQSAIVKRIR
jgi:hypothetical protein